VLRIVAGSTRYCDRFHELRVHEVPMTSFATAIAEAGFFQIDD